MRETKDVSHITGVYEIFGADRGRHRNEATSGLGSVRATC
jgi:hypothetical protein